MKAFKLLFMVAEVLRTVGAREHGVGVVIVALRTQISAQLPADKKQKGEANKHIGQRVPEEDEGSEHHDKVPVIDTAAAAAFVLHHPCLEGAEEKNANHVAHGIGKGD